MESLPEALSFEMAMIGVCVKIVEPGMVWTDSAGRSLAFSNDERLTEYQPLIERLMVTTAAVAETIVRSVMDGSDQLRCVVGADGEILLARRKAEDDALLRAMFGL